MKDFTGKVAFITGGASGAGLGQAKVFSEAGCKVVIADIRQDHLDEAVEYFHSRNATVHAIMLDITDRKAYTAAADEVERVFGSPPQLLINTAGVNVLGPAEASTFEDYDWVMGVCLGGVINGMVTFVPRMIKAGKGGHIATTSSWGGFMGGATTAPYSAAKAAVNNFTQWLAVHFARTGVRVNAIAPGFLLTDQNRFLLFDEDSKGLTPRGRKIVNSTPLERYGTPEDLTGTLLYLVSGWSEFVTGAIIPVDGGFNAYSGV